MDVSRASAPVWLEMHTTKTHDTQKKCFST